VRRSESRARRLARGRGSGRQRGARACGDARCQLQPLFERRSESCREHSWGSLEQEAQGGKGKSKGSLRAYAGVGNTRLRLSA
jgi:hypothetical protein